MWRGSQAAQPPRQPPRSQAFPACRSLPACAAPAPRAAWGTARRSPGCGAPWPAALPGWPPGWRPGWPPGWPARRRPAWTPGWRRGRRWSPRRAWRQSRARRRRAWRAAGWEAPWRGSAAIAGRQVLSIDRQCTPPHAVGRSPCPRPRTRRPAAAQPPTLHPAPSAPSAPPSSQTSGGRRRTWPARRRPCSPSSWPAWTPAAGGRRAQTVSGERGHRVRPAERTVWAAACMASPDSQTPGRAAAAAAAAAAAGAALTAPAPPPLTSASRCLRSFSALAAAAAASFSACVAW